MSPLEVDDARDENEAPTVTLDRRLWLTADKERVVEDGDSAAAFLLGSEGEEIPEEEAKRLGLRPAKKQAAAPADKQKAAPANKARSTRKRTTR